MWPPLSCFTLLDVSSTNWLPTGIRGAKEPLDGQRLEVYPGINVSKSSACVIHRNQPSSLWPAIKEKLTFPLCQHQLTSVCTLLVKTNPTFFFQWVQSLRDSLGPKVFDIPGFYLILLLRVMCHSRLTMNMWLNSSIAFSANLGFCTNYTFFKVKFFKAWTIA